MKSVGVSFNFPSYCEFGGAHGVERRNETSGIDSTLYIIL